MNNIIKIGCEIFIVKDNALLLGKRKNCYGAGTWALPGGHLEYGETLIECAKRELKEELGIEGLEFTLLSVIDSIAEQRHYLHMSFLLHKFTGTIATMEPDLCEEWCFFDMAQLPETIFEPHKKIIETCVSRIQSDKVLAIV